MPLITIFSSPKPFNHPHINMIQKNAIKSWLQMQGRISVYLVGNEDGVEEIANEYRIGYIPEVERNNLGTPYVSSIINKVKEESDAEILIYTNADILFPPDLVSAVTYLSLRFPKFLGVGYRWDVEIEEEINVLEQSYQEIHDRLLSKAVKNRSVAIDYFVFPKAIFTDVPDFAVGRSGWDNWMIYHAIASDWPVIDLSPEVQVIHQNHDYHHLPNRKSHYKLKESEQNVKLAGGADHMYSLLDSRLEYRNGEIRLKKMSLKHLFRKLELLVSSGTEKKMRWRLSRKIRKLWVRLENKERRHSQV